MKKLFDPDRKFPDYNNKKQCVIDLVYLHLEEEELPGKFFFLVEDGVKNLYTRFERLVNESRFPNEIKDELIGYNTERKFNERDIETVDRTRRKRP